MLGWWVGIGIGVGVDIRVVVRFGVKRKVGVRARFFWERRIFEFRKRGRRCRGGWGVKMGARGLSWEEGQGRRRFRGQGRRKRRTCIRFSFQARLTTALIPCGPFP